MNFRLMLKMSSNYFSDPKYNRVNSQQLMELLVFYIQGLRTDDPELTTTEIYKILQHLSVRYTRTRNKSRLPMYGIYEVAQEISNDLLMRIVQKPEEFTNPLEFHKYLKAVVWRQSSFFWRQYYKLYDNGRFIYINDNEEGLPAELEFAHSSKFDIGFNIEREDNIKWLVMEIKKELKNTIKFKNSSDFLLWPMVLCITTKSDKIFKGFRYEDRTALRAMLARCVFRARKMADQI